MEKERIKERIASIEEKIQKERIEKNCSRLAVCSKVETDSDVAEIISIFKQYLQKEIVSEIKRQIAEKVREFDYAAMHAVISKAVSTFTTEYLGDVAYTYYFESISTEVGKFKPEELFGKAGFTEKLITKDINRKIFRDTEDYFLASYEKEFAREKEEIRNEYASKTMEEQEAMAREYLSYEGRSRLKESLMSYLFENLSKPEQIESLEQRAMYYYMVSLVKAMFTALSYTKDEKTSQFKKQRFGFGQSNYDSLESAIKARRERNRIIEDLGEERKTEEPYYITFDSELSLGDAIFITITEYLTGKENVLGKYKDITIQPKELIAYENWKPETLTSSDEVLTEFLIQKSNLFAKEIAEKRQNENPKKLIK